MWGLKSSRISVFNVHKIQKRGACKVINVCRNFKAWQTYGEDQVIEKLECGLKLLGSEVKSLRAIMFDISTAFVDIDKSELWLCNSYAPVWRNGAHGTHLEYRKRKLLAHKKEISRLEDLITQNPTYDIVPWHCYFNERGLAKMIISVVQRKKRADNREKELKKEFIREKASLRV